MPTTAPTPGDLSHLRKRAVQYALLLLLATAFALANGMGYGSGNHRQYLLHGLHALDPTFLANDWFTTQTQPHHRAFNAAMVVVGRVVRLDVAFAVANALTAAAFTACIAALVARFYRAPVMVTAVTLLIIVFTPSPGLGSTTIVKSYFEPATIGSVGLLIGLVLLVYERCHLAGLALFLAALLHINYMAWAVVLVGGVVVLHGRRLGWRSSLWLVGPLVPTVVFHLPFLLAGQSAAQSACGAEAGRILHDIYMPLHSRPRTWGLDPFMRFAAILAAGAIAVLMVRPQRLRGGLMPTIVGLLGTILLAAAAFTLIVENDTLAMLFPWRLGPLLVLMAQIAVAGALVTTAMTPARPWPQTLALWLVLGGLVYVDGIHDLYGVACVFSVVAALAGIRLAAAVCETVRPAIGAATVRERGGPGDSQATVRAPSCWFTILLAAAGVAALYLAGAGRSGAALAGCFLAAGLLAWNGRPRPLAAASRRLLPAIGPAVLILLIVAFIARIGLVRKDLLGPPPPRDEAALYAWCRANTDRGDIFVIPPLLVGFRLGAERAVVIDWKCMPVLPCDTVEWYCRHVAVCGVDFASPQEAMQGYRALDAKRARTLQATYGARYMVVEKEHEGDLNGLRGVYEGEGYRVLQIASSMD